jgi:hypothetical protein
VATEMLQLLQDLQLTKPRHLFTETQIIQQANDLMRPGILRHPQDRSSDTWDIQCVT